MRIKERGVPRMTFMMVVKVFFFFSFFPWNVVYYLINKSPCWQNFFYSFKLNFWKGVPFCLSVLPSVSPYLKSLSLVCLLQEILSVCPSGKLFCSPVAPYPHLWLSYCHFLYLLWGLYLLPQTDYNSFELNLNKYQLNKYMN